MLKIRWFNIVFYIISTFNIIFGLFGLWYTTQTIYQEIIHEVK